MRGKTGLLRRLMNGPLGLFLVPALSFITGSALAQTPDSSQFEPVEAPPISIQAILDRTQVPQNRTVTLTVELRWHDDLDRYEVASVEQPVVRNLEIVGTGSSNRVEADEAGRPVAVQTYTFTLKPKELGMAYVEGLTVLYTDTKTGKSHRLMTQRLQLEVTDPIPEGRGPRNWLVFAVGAVAVVAAAVVFYFRRSRGGLPEGPVEQEPTLEEKFLDQLRREVNTNTPAFNVKDGYAQLSKIVRRYLAEKYGLSGVELTTDELLQELRQTVGDERLIHQAEEILRRCDRVKFGGETGDVTEVSRFAGVVELWLSRPTG